MESSYPVVRSIVYINGRKVHFRSCGTGPAVFLLHGSPQSSWAVLPLAQHLAQNGMCAIAPDTPGYGMSEPLSTSVASNNTTVDYADSLIALADKLDIEQFGLFGFHTGAAIACTVAARYPLRACALACDGLTAWTDTERNTILQGYLPPFEPQWDGSHMAWLWARIEEQVAFFPWHIAEHQYKMDFDMSPVARIHANAMDVLRAGDGYRRAYHAAFTFRTESWLPKVTCPTFFACIANDPLAEHYCRDIFSQYETATFTAIKDMHDRFTALFESSPGSNYSALHLQDKDNFGVTHGWIGEPGAALAWCGTTTHSSKLPTLVLLHGAGGNKEEFRGLLRLLCQQRNVIAIDLPGHGDSEDLAEPPTNVAAIGQTVVEHCALLGLHTFIPIGRGLGSLVAGWIVNHQHAPKGAAIGLPDIPDNYKATWAEHYCSDLTPVWDGAHLLRAFRIARWERIYAPWFARTVSNRRAPNALLDAGSIHQRACSLLKAGNAFNAAVHAETTLELRNMPKPGDRFAYFSVAREPAGYQQQLSALGIDTLELDVDDVDWYHAIMEL